MFQEFEFQDFNICNMSKISRFRDSKVSIFQDFQDFNNSRFRIFKISRIQDLETSRFQLQDFKISILQNVINKQDFKIPKCFEIQGSEYEHRSNEVGEVKLLN